MAQLKAEADAKEETAKRLAAQLEDERQQDERGQCMVEEISEHKLRRAIQKGRVCGETFAWREGRRGRKRTSATYYL